MSAQSKANYVALLPRKPSATFIAVFQSHSFNDNLRPSSSKSKGITAGHFITVIGEDYV